MLHALISNPSTSRVINIESLWKLQVFSFQLQFRFLNFTDVHLIAVAKDSGTPPRESSVPVIVHLPNHKKSELRQKEEETFTLMVNTKMIFAFQIPKYSLT
jgi:hypothetical protein